MKKIILIVTLGVFMATPFSCTYFDDLLEQQPLGRNYSDVFWVDQSGAESGLAGAYSILRSTLVNGGSILWWGDFPGMFLLRSNHWIVNYIHGGNYFLAYWEYTREWNTFYRVITITNLIQKHVPNIPLSEFRQSGMTEAEAQKVKDRIMGEALFLRALSYFYVARIWGDAPLITEAIESSDQLVDDDGFIIGVGRTDDIQILEQILKDLDQAKEWLDYSMPGDRNWAVQANKGSAEALEAHASAWLASRVTGADRTAYLQRAKAAATNVINNSGASLLDYSDPNAVSQMFFGRSSEGLFELNLSSSSNESFRVSNSTNHHVGFLLDQPYLANRNNHACRPIFDTGRDLINRYPEDYRITQFFHNYGPEGFLIKYANMSPDEASTDQFAYFTESNLIIFRLADIILLRAEVSANLGDYNQALTDLNTIRNRANLPNYTGTNEDMHIEIFNQRAIELVGEGHSAFDRIRINYWEGVPWMTPQRYEQEGYFWPIQPNYLLINRELEQNQWWRGRI